MRTFNEQAIEAAEAARQNRKHDSQYHQLEFSDLEDYETEKFDRSGLINE